MGSYIYAADAHNLWINLYVGSRTRIETPNGAIDLRVNTRYPLDGRINITVNATRSIRHTLREACIALQRGPVVYCVEAPDNSASLERSR